MTALGFPIGFFRSDHAIISVAAGLWLRRVVDPFVDQYMEDAPVYAGKVHLLTPWVMSDQRVVLKFTFMCVFFLSSQMMTSLCICLSLTPSSHLFIISEECQHSTNTPAASCLQTDGQTDAIGGLLM